MTAPTTDASVAPFGTLPTDSGAETALQIPIAVPPSVVAYYKDKKTQTAVNLLLTKDQPDIPEDLEWDEVPSFYRACLAARQTQLELAAFLAELWKKVWAEPLRSWNEDSPHKPREKSNSIKPATVWDGESITRSYTNEDGDVVAYLWVYIEDDSLKVGFGAWRDDVDVWKDNAPDGWEPYDDNYYSPTPEAVRLPIGSDNIVDAAPLRALAEMAESIIVERVEATK